MSRAITRARRRCLRRAARIWTRRTAFCAPGMHQADALFDAGEYELAAKGFAELGSYEDAKQRVNASEDAWLGKTYNSAKLDMDLGDYAAVVDELEAYQQSDHARALRRSARYV